MARLAESAAMRAQLGENLYEKASREFSISATVGKQIEIYQTILRRTAMPKKKKYGVLICGAYGKGNAGDDAILKAILAQMKAIDRDMPVYVMSHDPARDAPAVPRRLRTRIRPLRASGRSCGRCRLFISGGGSLIQNETSTRSLKLLPHDHPHGAYRRLPRHDVRLRHRPGQRRGAAAAIPHAFSTAAWIKSRYAKIFPGRSFPTWA